MPDGMLHPFRQAAAISFPASEWEQVRERGIPYTRRWTSANGAISTRIIVRDTHTGKYGTLDLQNKLLFPEPAKPVIQ